ncbi:TCR/Tet family MFS transporter [Devosia sp. ZB163]|uniref:TCR/Tet family MFS transporter n=1 Tax=Devosia sp. ZB163 TaxID=3025938 RepID=UPI00236016DA|nr:TCR/Tet family MFS transporter [Devosia sp. ZB163]MDC9824513.1 TCR/Tet family MFS transporter [Devosia sp. ZB163]
MPVSPQSNLTLACVLVTIFLDMLGYGIILPVLPQLIGQLSGGSVAQAAVIGGYLVFAYSLMQFLFGPALGNLSDRFGRRPIILIALAGLTIDYTIMGLANSLVLIFIGHTIAGISGASVATATAYIADITPREKRAHRFGLIGAAFGLGFIFGPVVGGLLGELGPRWPFYAAAALAGANLLFGFFVLPESLPRDKRRPFDIRRANPFGVLWSLSKNPVVLWLLAVLGLFVLASQAFPSVWNFFTIEVLSFSSSQIGIALGAFGIGFAMSQAFLIAPVTKRIGEWSTVLLGMLAAAIAFTGTAFIHSELPLYGFLVFGSLAGLAGPAINSLMSRQVPDDAQGELQGAINATNSLASILGPLLATQLFSRFTQAQPGEPGYFPGAPFLGAGILVVCAAALFVYVVRRFDLMHRPRVSKKEHIHEMAQPGQQQTPPHDENGNGTQQPLGE